MSSFKKDVGKFITREKQAEYTKRWSDKKSLPETKSNFFGSDIINEILSTPGCTGIHIHHGINELGQMAPILVANIDNTGTASVMNSDPPPGGNASMACPPTCS